MNVLPRFLYLFQCIPLYLPKSFFKSIDKALISFKWDGKKPRIQLELLQRPKKQGGLALPNFTTTTIGPRMLKKIIYWLHTPDWCHFEAAFCISTSLRALVTSSFPLSFLQYTNNPIVINTLKVWVQIRWSFGFKNLLHLDPIHNNHLFPQLGQILNLRSGRDEASIILKDMYINGTFASFEDLSHKFDLPRSSSFRYFQVRHFLQHHDPNFPYITSPSGLDDLLKSPFNSKRLVSRISDCITSFKYTTLAKIRADWVDELGEDLEEGHWESALLRVNDSTSCANLSIIQFQGPTSHPLLQSEIG